MTLALAAHCVSHRFGAIVALEDVSLEIAAGTTTAIVGESGSGKTTFLRCFNRLVEPGTGSVSVGGVDVRAQPVADLRRRLGYVPQLGGLLPHWRVLTNVALVPSLLGNADATRAASDALALVGLPTGQFGQRYPHELSGGQRQRVALARAVAARPGAILLDEPFGALDAITRSDAQGVFEQVRREIAITALLITHDLAEAARLADDIVVMRGGRVEQRGTAAELLAHPATEYVAALFERALAASTHLSRLV